MDDSNTDLADTFTDLEQRMREIANEVHALRGNSVASGMLDEHLAAAERMADDLMGAFNTLAMQVGDGVN